MIFGFKVFVICDNGYLQNVAIEHVFIFKKYPDGLQHFLTIVVQ